MVDPGRIPLRWGLLTILLWPGIALVAAGTAGLVAGSESDHLSAVALAALIGDPIGLLGTLLLILLIGPLPEEIGWRGYWLDRLQLRWTAFSASLVLGVAWAVWHAPLFLMAGYFDAWEFSPDPVFYAASIVLGAVLYTWIYKTSIGASSP